MRLFYNLVLFLFFYFFIGCKNDDIDPGNTKEDGLQPTQMRIAHTNSNETLYNFEYDTSDNLIKAVLKYSSLSDIFWSGTFQYDSNGRLVSGFYDGDMNADGKVDSNDKFTLYFKYDSKGNIEYSFHKDADGIETIQSRFEYDQQGHISKILNDFWDGRYTRYEKLEKGSRKYKKATVYDPVKGNVSKEYLAQEIFSFDGKKGAFSVWKPTNFIALLEVNLFVDNQFDMWSHNNFTESRNYSPEGTLIYTNKATYIYNEKGYPVGINWDGALTEKAFEYQ